MASRVVVIVVVPASVVSVTAAVVHVVVAITTHVAITPNVTVVVVNVTSVVIVVVAVVVTTRAVERSVFPVTAKPKKPPKTPVAAARNVNRVVENSFFVVIKNPESARDRG